MSLKSAFTALFMDAVLSDSQVQDALREFLPLDLSQWQIRKAEADTVRQGPVLLAYPTKDTAGLYLVFSPIEDTALLPSPRAYLLEVMADTPENGCELLVVRRIAEEFKVLYTDLAVSAESTEPTGPLS